MPDCNIIAEKRRL